MPDLFRRLGKLVNRGRRGVTLDPVRSSPALAVDYRVRLGKLLDEQQASLLYWLKAEWRKQPTLAQDAAVDDLQRAFRKLNRRWGTKFDALAPQIAQLFARSAMGRVDARLRAVMREAGLTVEFVASRAVREAYRAAVAENVSLITNLGEQHRAAVEQAVLRSVSAGRDLASLTEDLVAQQGITRRRAARIALDQNNRATAVITKVRQVELGITHARWRHSAGGRVPRPSHVAASKEGVVYDVETGWFDPDEQKFVWPGTLFRCRCYAQPIIPGFE